MRPSAALTSRKSGCTFARPTTKREWDLLCRALSSKMFDTASQARGIAPVLGLDAIKFPQCRPRPNLPETGRTANRGSLIGHPMRTLFHEPFANHRGEFDASLMGEIAKSVFHGRRQWNRDRDIAGVAIGGVIHRAWIFQ